MELRNQLVEFKAEFGRTAPAGWQELFDAKIEELRASFPIEKAIGVNDHAPDFSLPNTAGEQVTLSTLLVSGPAVVTFYRGGWCPYCNLQLRAYQAILPEISALGARLVAISPQLPDRSYETAEKNLLGFDVLSDAGNHVARDFGLVYSVPDELRAVFLSIDKALPGINGDDSWELPIPATYVMAEDRRIALAFLDVDYRNRLEPDEILTSLNAVARKSSCS
jgi:peroxiredoxin